MSLGFPDSNRCGRDHVSNQPDHHRERPSYRPEDSRVAIAGSSQLSLNSSSENPRDDYKRKSYERDEKGRDGRKRTRTSDSRNRGIEVYERSDRGRDVSNRRNDREDRRSGASRVQDLASSRFHEHKRYGRHSHRNDRYE